MENIRNSDVLEKEVLEDARKKAEKILKNSEKNITDLQEEWDSKKQSEISLLNAEFNKKTDLLQQEQESFLPLEMQRRKLNYLNDIFEKFVSSFINNLSADELVHVLSNRGLKAASFFAEHSRNDSIEILYAGISAEAAASIAALVTEAPAPKETTGFHGLIFSCKEKRYRYRLTVDEIIDELREYHRQPIMKALWKDL